MRAAANCLPPKYPGQRLGEIYQSRLRIIQETDFNFENLVPRSDDVVLTHRLPSLVVTRIFQEPFPITPSKQPHHSCENLVAHKEELVDVLIGVPGEEG